MNSAEALGLLDAALGRLRPLSYEDLAQRVDAEPEIAEAQGQSGALYQIELSVMWDDRARGNIRVMGSVDDGRWRAFMPLTRSFIKAPDGTFVGEELG